MIRKLLLGAGALSLATGVLIGTGAASAAPTPVKMSGAIKCNAFGSISFVTPLRDGGGTATAFSILIRLDGCTGAGTTSGPVTVTGGTLTATSLTTVKNNCGAVTAGEALPAMQGSIAWTATGGSARATNVSITTPYVFYRYNDNLLWFGFPSTLTSGSYVGQPAIFTNMTSNASGGKNTGECATGQPGLQTIFFGKTPASSGGTPGRLTIKGL